MSLNKKYISQIQLKGETIKQIGNIVQNDISSNLFIVRLVDDGKPFDITGYTNITFSVIKPDGTYCVDSLGDRITVLDPLLGVISIKLHDNAIDVSGTCTATLEVFGTAPHRMSSSRMSYVVTGDITAGADPTADSSYPVLVQLILDVQTLETNTEAAEALRVTAESGRVTAETARVTAETGRSTAETERAGAETTRASNETERGNAEALRVTAETDRANAEIIRAAVIAALSGWEAYNPATAYIPLNKVVYQGSSYINDVACQGVLPTDTSKWTLIAAKGIDGEGSGDMLESVYDPTGKSQDVFGYADSKFSTEATARTDADNALVVQISTLDGNKVSTSRTINEKSLTSNIALTAEDIGVIQTDSYMAFCGNVNATMIDAAFGKNNSDLIVCLGKQLAMYAWFKGDSKITYPFTNLAMENSLSEILSSTLARKDMFLNTNLVALLFSAPYVMAQFSLAVNLTVTAGTNYGTEYTQTTTTTFTQDEIDGGVMFEYISSNPATTCLTTFKINGNIVQSVNTSVSLKTSITNLASYGVTAGSTVTLVVTARGEGGYTYQPVSTAKIYKCI